MVNFDVHRVFIGLVFGRIREGDVTEMYNVNLVVSFFNLIPFESGIDHSEVLKASEWRLASALSSMFSSVFRFSPCNGKKSGQGPGY